MRVGRCYVPDSFHIRKANLNIIIIGLSQPGSYSEYGSSLLNFVETMSSYVISINTKNLKRQLEKDVHNKYNPVF